MNNGNKSDALAAGWRRRMHSRHSIKVLCRVWLGGILMLLMFCLAGHGGCETFLSVPECVRAVLGNASRDNGGHKVEVLLVY